MFREWSAIKGQDRFNLLVLAGFFAVLLLFGGASRPDVIGQAVVRITSIAVIVSCAMQLTRENLSRVAAPSAILLALAILIGIQLIPLPPDIWGKLPGHGTFGELARAGGLAPAWRPLSLAPDLTLNALLALLPAFAALLLMALVPRDLYSAVLLLLLAVVAISVGLGVLQVGAGAPYFYKITNEGSAVGAFANRNHNALLVSLSLPLLAGWFAVAQTEGGAVPGVRSWIFVSAAILVFPVLLVTGSRGGLILGAIGLVFALLIAIKATKPRHRRPIYLGGAIALGLILATVTLFIALSRDEAFRRLVDSGRTELRSDVWPTVWRMIWDFFPAGSGFGSFDPLYRFYERHEDLGPFYLNQAHNDLLQIILEGGLAAGLIVLAGSAWFLIRAFKTWRAPNGPDSILGRTGTAMLAMIAAGSLFDYPLRTPLMAVLFVVAMAWTSAKSSAWHTPPVGNTLAGRPSRKSARTAA